VIRADPGAEGRVEMPALPQRPARAAALALLAAAAVAGCGGSSGGGSTAKATSTGAAAPAPAAAPVRSATVDIKSFKFKPVAVAVRKGGQVKWTNSDAAAHTATADDRSFDTQTIDKGKAATVTFAKAGSFAYHCDFHPFMKATVVVK
jgi:plastocyanin